LGLAKIEIVNTITIFDPTAIFFTITHVLGRTLQASKELEM
jgi:hypothetical protein